MAGRHNSGQPQDPVDRFILAFVSVSLMVGGVVLWIWPAAAAIQNRDDDTATPASALEVRRIRIAALLMIAAGGYGLYATVMNLPGAEFIGV